MATTTNFGWETPDDTDLVKDGALAIRTLGSAIDTSLVDLKGGTTGQVLSKTSNTDMDFTWVTSDDANAIQNAIVDAKGDIIAASAADTPARLAVGNNGETLVADSSTSTGLRWQGSYPAGRNGIINGAMQIWQRGTSLSVASGSLATTGYTTDRWTGYFPTATTVSRQSTNDTTNLPFIQYCARIQRDSGSTNTTVRQFTTSLETVNSLIYAGRTVTVSFYARKGANFSSSSDLLNVKAIWGTGTDQNYTGTYTGATAFIDQNATLTATWQRFTYTGSVGSTATEVALQFQYTPTGTAGASDFFEITGVQWEIGSVATAFQTATGTLAGELAACQRYYYRVGGDQIYQRIAIGSWSSTTNLKVVVQNPVPMRVAPSTSLEYGTLTTFDGVNFYAVSAITAPGDASSKLTYGIDITTATSTQYRPGWLLTNNSTNGYFGLSAEL